MLASDMIMKFEGFTGQIELYKDKLIIKHGSLTFKGQKTIYLSQLTGIQLKPGGYLLYGYIQFTVPEGNNFAFGLKNLASSDENTIEFYKGSNDSAIALKEKIEELIYVSEKVLQQSVALTKLRSLNNFLTMELSRKTNLIRRKRSYLVYNNKFFLHVSFQPPFKLFSLEFFPAWKKNSPKKVKSFSLKFFGLAAAVLKFFRKLSAVEISGKPFQKFPGKFSRAFAKFDPRTHPLPP